MTAVAAEADPYVLPVPAPDSPVVLSKRVSPGNPHPVSRYQDLVWSLAPLIDNPPEATSGTSTGRSAPGSCAARSGWPPGR